MGTQKKIPNKCPACGSALKVTALACISCDTCISGSFDLPLFSRLSNEEWQFVLDFVKSSGSLKIMAQQLGFSYPTVRNMLDDIIHKINTDE